MKTKLGTLLKIKQGFAFKSQYYVEKSNYRLVTLGNFSNQNAFEYNNAKATYYGDSFPPDFILKENDLIMPLTEQVVGLFGNSAFIPKEDKFQFVLNQRVARIDCDETKIDKYYLHYLLATKEVKKQLEARATGTRQRNISSSDVYDVEVIIPDLKTQKVIGNFLYNIEKKQENNNKINAELESLAKTIYDYWFLQFEFPNEEGKPYKSSGGKMVWNEELKREIPEGWRKGSLSDICSITMGASPNGESLNENQSGLIFYQGKADFSFRFPSIRMFTTSPIRYAKKNDVLISVRAPVGDLNIANNDCCIGRGLAALHSSYPSYLYYKMVSSKNLFSYYNQNGTTFGAVTKENLHNLEIVVPNEKTIMLFEKTISPLDKKISILSQENQELSSLRDFLLPMLMNGQITFR